MFFFIKGSGREWVGAKGGVGAGRMRRLGFGLNRERALGGEKASDGGRAGSSAHEHGERVGRAREATPARRKNQEEAHRRASISRPGLRLTPTRSPPATALISLHYHAPSL